VRYTVDINAAIEEAMSIVGAGAKGSAIRYETILDRSLPPLMAEPTGLEQVLINFILNARDAGARLVRIESAPSPDRVGYLCVTVADDGSGIASDVLGKVFQPFFTTKRKGTGLGLWLSQRIVQDHGGTIAVESKAGKGATFAITLPTINESSAGRVGLPAQNQSATPPQIAAARSKAAR